MAEEKKKKETKVVKKVQKASKEETQEAEKVEEKALLKKAEEKEKESKKTEKEQKQLKKEEKKEEKPKEKAEAEKIIQRKRHGKKYRSSKEKIDKTILYEIDEAIDLVKNSSVTKFDSTIDLHLRIDKKIENLRGVVNLPAGSAKKKLVLAVTDKNIAEVIEKVKSGKTDFDIMLATPQAMPKLASLAKILGPKGLMPNPKSGTVTENIEETTREFESGKIEFKADKGNNIHISIAKVSFEHDQIKQNLEAVLAAVPIGKVLSAHLTTSMGPSIRVKVGK